MKKVLPTIKIVPNELPDWIIPSDTGAYCPFNKTIWVAYRNPWQFCVTFVHELIHWVFDILGAKKAVHNRYDALWKLYFKKVEFKKRNGA